MNYQKLQDENLPTSGGNRTRRRSPRFALARTLVVLIIALLMFSFVAHNFSRIAEAASPPAVDGLFYKDGDNALYSPYGFSEHGSGLHVFFDDPNIYVALVVDRTVNDNVCAPNTGGNLYTKNAGWDNHRDCKRNTDSEFAEFTLRCTMTPNSWTWRQSYTSNVGGVWISTNTILPGTGIAPPGYTAGSSMAWNFNNYIANYPANPWDLYQGGGPTADMRDWKSPYAAGSPNVVVGLDGYPATGPITYSPTYQWEWAMVYEWSADISICGNNPIFVLAGASHHSPIKNGDPDSSDDFDPDPDPDPLSDYGDLPDSYGTLDTSGGAQHHLKIGGVHLGIKPDPEKDGQPSTDATGDEASVDDEDGVTRGGTSWQPGNTVSINLNVQGPAGTADVGVWIDWNNDGDFDDPGEFYSYLDLATGVVHNESLVIPGSYTTGQVLNVRVRIVADEADFPGGSLDSTDYEGVATSGEVEDYQWTFSPTAITLINSTASNEQTGLVLILGLTTMVLLATAFILRRRQIS